MDLESASVSASSEDLAGAGATGGTTGTAVEDPSTITITSRIAGTSVTTGSITVIPATATSATAAPTMAADSTGLRVSTEVPTLTEVPTFTLSQEHTPARSVALITAEVHEAFPPAGSQALEEAACMPAASMAEAAMGAVDGTR